MRNRLRVSKGEKRALSPSVQTKIVLFRGDLNSDRSMILAVAGNILQVIDSIAF